MDKKLLNRAIRKAKGQVNLAKELKFSRQFLNQVIKGRRPMPDKYWADIEAIANR